MTATTEHALGALLDSVKLDPGDIGPTAVDSALRVLVAFTARLDDAQSQRDTIVVLAHRVGATYEAIAEACGVAPQTAANIVRRHSS